MVSQEERKQFLVVGGGSGIGAEIVRQLSERGASVLVLCRGPEKVAALPSVTAGAWDATASEMPDDVVPRRLDGLAYCPGSIQLKPFQQLRDSDFLADLEVNLLGAVRAVRGCLASLRRTRGSIVLFSTVAVERGMRFHASVASAKGAVEGLSRSLAAELAPQVRVNCIAPSLTDTPLAARLLATPERRAAAAERHPLAEIGAAADVARLAVSLLDQEFSWMTGQVLRPDGGLSSVHTS